MGFVYKAVAGRCTPWRQERSANQRTLIQINQITESLSVAFKCLRPSTAPATVKASASASVM